MREQMPADRDEPVAAPPKKFFNIRHAEGILGDTPPLAREAPAAAEPVRESPSFDADAARRVRTKYRRSRQSSDEPRPRSHRTRDDAVPPLPPVASAPASAPDSPRESRPRHSRTDTEDAARKARHVERRRIREDKDDKKPGGIKAAFKKLFG